MYLVLEEKINKLHLLKVEDTDYEVYVNFMQDFRYKQALCLIYKRYFAMSRNNSRLSVQE